MRAVLKESVREILCLKGKHKKICHTVYTILEFMVVGTMNKKTEKFDIISCNNKPLFTIHKVKEAAQREHKSAL